MLWPPIRVAGGNAECSAEVQLADRPILLDFGVKQIPISMEQWVNFWLLYSYLVTKVVNTSLTK